MLHDFIWEYTNKFIEDFKWNFTEIFNEIRWVIDNVKTDCQRLHKAKNACNCSSLDATISLVRCQHFGKIQGYWNILNEDFLATYF